MIKPGFLFIAGCMAGVLLLSGCRMLSVVYPPSPTPLSMEQLIAILEASDPASPNYDPESKEFAAFWFAIRELAKFGPAAAPALARALQYPRRDFFLAAEALLAIGPAATPAIPELIKALKNDRPEVRSAALYILGVIGQPAQCAVPEIAPLLWDSKISVRVTAAIALDAITGKDLVDPFYKIDPARFRIRWDPLPGEQFDDRPVIRKARDWWIEEGQYMDWRDESGFCNPQSTGPGM